MPWNNPAEVPVGSNGQVYVATVGATAPTAHDSVLAPATWAGLGYISEDGIQPKNSKEVSDINAWQEQDPIRREVLSRSQEFALALMQWNENTLIAAFGGGSISSAGTGYKYTPPLPGDALLEQALVIDIKDGTYTYRYYAPRVTVFDDVETTFKRGEAGLLPVNFKALVPNGGGSPWALFSNAPGLATGS